jgi:hypothetical protein
MGVDGWSLSCALTHFDARRPSHSLLPLSGHRPAGCASSKRQSQRGRIAPHSVFYWCKSFHVVSRVCCWTSRHALFAIRNINVSLVDGGTVKISHALDPLHGLRGHRAGIWHERCDASICPIAISCATRVCGRRYWCHDVGHDVTRCARSCRSRCLSSASLHALGLRCHDIGRFVASCSADVGYCSLYMRLFCSPRIVNAKSVDDSV